LYKTVLHRLIREQPTPLTFNLFLFLEKKFIFETEAFLLHVFGRKGEKIMAKIFALKTDQVQRFEPKDQKDIPVEERTAFLCRFLDVKLSADISDEVYTAKGFGNKREELLRAGTQELKILRRGLVGWENFTYEDGTAVEWEEVPSGLSMQKMAAAMDKNLNKIPPEIRAEVADFIRGSSTLDQD